MNKTLLKDFTELTGNQIVTSPVIESTEDITELMREMKGVWQEAANDLLQPRTAVLDQLLKKVLH